MKWFNLISFQTLLSMTSPCPAEEPADLSAAKPVEIIAHRGASFDAPENTLASVKLAWQQQADAVEIDVFVTQDSQIVAVHDRNLERTTGLDREVQELTLAEIRRLDAGSWKAPKWKGEPIPTLKEVVDTIPEGKRLFVEIKCGLEILEPLKDYLSADRPDPSSIVFISFNLEVIRTVKSEFPNHSALWISGFKRNAQTGDWTPEFGDLIAHAKKSGLDGLDVDARGPVELENISKVLAAGLKLVVWTVNDPDRARELAETGVQGITTDRPGWLRDHMIWDQP